MVAWGLATKVDKRLPRFATIALSVVNVSLAIVHVGVILFGVVLAVTRYRQLFPYLPYLIVVQYVCDGDLLDAIRAVLAATPFHGEGYRKVRARLAHWGDAVGGKRVLRLMRTNGLLAPRRLGPPNGDPAHAGTIVTDRPDVMWGTDATRFYTEQDGWC